MRNFVAALVLAVVPLAGFAAVIPCRAETIDQPVFLLCPHKTRYSAWSLYVTVDRSNPAKIFSIGLEKLKKQNSVDTVVDGKTGFDAVLAAQRDPKIERETLATLDAVNFKQGSLDITQDDALHITATPESDGSLRLMLSLRIGASDRFIIGGKEQDKRDVALRFNRELKQWEACALKLQDAQGKPLVGANPVPISGFAFNIVGTGIYRILGLVGGEAVLLLDRETSPEARQP